MPLKTTFACLTALGVVERLLEEAERHIPVKWGQDGFHIDVTEIRPGWVKLIHAIEANPTVKYIINTRVFRKQTGVHKSNGYGYEQRYS